MGTRHAVFGIYRNSEQIDKASGILKTRGFNRSNILILYPDKRGLQNFAYELRTMVGPVSVIGASIGLIVGLSIGIFGFSGLNFVIFGAVLGCFFGAMAGALMGVGVPESPVQRYIEYLDDGGILLSVHTNSPDRAELAAKILEDTGGTDVTSANEFRTWRTVVRHAWKLRTQKLISHAK